MRVPVVRGGLLILLLGVGMAVGSPFRRSKVAWEPRWIPKGVYFWYGMITKNPRYLLRGVAKNEEQLVDYMVRRHVQMTSFPRELDDGAFKDVFGHRIARLYRDRLLLPKNKVSTDMEALKDDMINFTRGKLDKIILRMERPDLSEEEIRFELFLRSAGGTSWTPEARRKVRDQLWQEVQDVYSSEAAEHASKDLLPFGILLEDLYERAAEIAR